MIIDLCPDCGDYIGEGCTCYAAPTNQTYIHADKIKGQRIYGAVKQLGLSVMHFPSQGLLAFEIGRMLSEPVSVEEMNRAMSDNVPTLG